MDNDMLQDIKDDIGELRNEINRLNHKVSYVEVRNGGGLSVKLKREDFYQKVFDKPDLKDVTTIVKKAVRDAPINSFRIIVRDVTLIGGMVLILLKIFGVIGS